MELFFHNEKSYVTMEIINANAMEWDLNSLQTPSKKNCKDGKEMKECTHLKKLNHLILN
ncbi:MAG: hypothetical protein K0S04_936 [Herbinix sp.]|nr:hypothetical protein [Herbinix sp.]